jgi:hypothetical protein
MNAKHAYWVGIATALVPTLFLCEGKLTYENGWYMAAHIAIYVIVVNLIKDKDY